MKKILHIIPSLTFGGVEKFLLDVFPFLSNHHDHFICPFLHTGVLYADFNSLQLKGGPNNRFWICLYESKSITGKLLKPLLWPYFIYSAWRLIKNERPDAIITYTSGAAFLLALLSLFSIKPKYTWFARIGSYLNFDYLPPHWLYNNIVSKTVLSSVLHIGKKLLFNNADCLIVVNSVLKNELLTQCNAQKKIVILTNCLSPKLIISENTYPSPFFVAAGRLEYIKGFNFLINTFATFSKHHPDFKLIIFGEGSQRKMLEKLIHSLGLDEKVQLPGFVKNPERFFSSAAAYISPSHSECCSKAILEAMQTRSIVISSNNDGSANIITNNINGILFRAGDSESLLNTLDYAVRMTEESKIKLKNNAYEQSLAYLPEQVASQFNAILDAEMI